MSQTALLSSLPIALPGLPAGDTLAISFTCSDSVGDVDISGATAIEFGIWQSATPTDSTPPKAFAELGDGITVTGVGNNVAEVICQTTGIPAGSYFYRMRVTLTPTNIVTFAKGTITLI